MPSLVFTFSIPLDALIKSTVRLLQIQQTLEILDNGGQAGERKETAPSDQLMLLTLYQSRHLSSLLQQAFARNRRPSRRPERAQASLQ